LILANVEVDPRQRRPGRQRRQQFDRGSFECRGWRLCQHDAGGDTDGEQAGEECFHHHQNPYVARTGD